MTTVVSRTFRSSPHRDALQTWDAIVELLTQGKDGTARSELRAVAGVAASLIADQAPKSAPIVATCDGPRTRIYCLFDEDAIDGDDANEEVLGFEPLKGDWGVSLPCPKEHRRHLLVHALGYLCDRQHPQELERHHPAQWAGPRALRGSLGEQYPSHQDVARDR